MSTAASPLPFFILDSSFLYTISFINDFSSESNENLSNDPNKYIYVTTY
ncbi:hypothetical protein JCM2421_18390 [Staphylococcus auricularis]|nr:hypothetical protein JCM2421_18390 [Staphylococcus auricularis]